MKKSIFLVVLIVFIFHSFGQEKLCPILPTPVTYQTTNELISIPKTIIIDTTNLNSSNLNKLKELGKTYHNLDFTLSKEQPLIVFRKLKNVNVHLKNLLTMESNVYPASYLNIGHMILKNALLVHKTNITI